MSMRLNVTVQFLSGMYHGQEWPPSPARLFQAVVAGNMAGCRKDAWSREDSDALYWLERCPPPEIVCPSAVSAHMYRLSVPNNNMDVLWRKWAKGMPTDRTERDLSTLKDVRPWLIRRDADDLTAVQYIWQVGEDSRSIACAQRVANMARNVFALGHGTDMVAVNGELAVDEARSKQKEHRVVPTDNRNARYSLVLRVPVRGFFDNLVETHLRANERIGNGIVNTGIHPTQYAEIPYRWADETPIRGSCAFRLTGSDGRPVAVRWKECMVVSAWVRHATSEFMQKHKRDQPWIDSYVLGHAPKGEPGPRLSYVPLPSIGHPNADGSIRRILVVEPKGTSVESALIEWGLPGTELTDTEGKVRATIAQPEPDDGVLERYLRESDTWLTVTPMILHGQVTLRGRFNVRKVEKLILQALTESGYDSSNIEEFWYQRAPLWMGTGGAADIQVPAHLSQWPRLHVGVKFKRPLRGPVIAGIGRHIGIGVFAAP